MHIVVVTGYYYPYLLPPAGCFKPYLLELAKEHEIEVVCPPSNIHYTQTIKREGIVINYINSFPNKWLSYIKTNQEEHKSPFLTISLFNLYRGLRYLKYTISSKPYETSLIASYIKRLNLIDQQNRIDAIVSVSFNFYTHVAALEYKKQHPSVKWITYTTDPLAYSEVNPIEKRKLNNALKIEKEVYSTCDKCIISEELYSNLVNDYKIEPAKILKLPYLLSPIHIDEIKEDRTQPMVLYAGYLYNSIRNPKPMLDIFSRIPSVTLQLHVTGDRFVRDMLSKFHTPNIIIDGLVSKEKYLQLIASADILVNLCNKIKLQAPSKISELVSTGKPIINFYYNKDSGYIMIEKYPLGLNLSYEEDLDTAVPLVESFISANINKRVSFDDVKSLYPEHLLNEQMPKVKELFL